MTTLIVGILFFGFVGWGAYKSHKSMKNNTCPGCSGGCSASQKSQCHR